MAQEEDRPKSKRLFINHVDQYQGKNLAKYLSRCVVGASTEEAEEEEDTKSISGSFVSPPKEGCYEVVGTVKDKIFQKPDFIREIILFDERDQLLEHLMECDVIVYDVSRDPDQIDEAIWAISELHADIDKIQKPKMYILISSCLTWAKSKSLDPDDPEIPFTEDDYRRRKPHQNFKEHISAEKTVIKLGKTNKSKLVAYCLCSALTYGAEENIFHYFFKSAWHNADELLCFGNGQNVVPVIHISDLAAIIQNIADSRPKVRYIIAKDDSQNTLEEIVKAISTSLGNGKVRAITREEALLMKDIEQADFDALLVNLRMDAVYVKESMHIRWVSEAGMVENMAQLVKEYKDSRHLQPLRAVILGPPASGKTTVCQRLCEHYKLHHINIKDVIDKEIERLTALTRHTESEDQEEDEGTKALEAQEMLDAINDSKEQGNQRISDEYVISFFKSKLLSMPCQNQGFILDGFPKTYEQAKDLFSNEEEEEGEDMAKAGNYDRRMMPEFIISLDATDEFLKNRIMNLPENVVAGTHNTEEGLVRRLLEFRQANLEDETVLNYFDELEFHPVHIDITEDDSEMMVNTVEKIKKIFGAPRNYGLSPEELEEERRQAEERRMKQEAEQKAEEERKALEEATERRRRQDEWTRRLTEVRREEYELLEAQSIPLRNYLMNHVMPTLTQGLIDCCKVRPDDPVDYLAEFLFQHNPQVD